MCVQANAVAQLEESGIRKILTHGQFGVVPHTAVSLQQIISPHAAAGP